MMLIGDEKDDSLKEFKVTERLMGNTFELTVVHADEDWAMEKISMAIAEIKRIERLFTTFSEDSQTNRINNAAGISAVQVDDEVFDLIARSIKISELTGGAFDISYGSLDKRLWNFDKTMTVLPDAATARSLVKLINYRNIILDKETHSVMLKEKGMRIGFGGIGKGYAADKAKAVLVSEGVKGGIVNASGDLTTWGLRAGGEPWKIGIMHPDNARLPFSHMDVKDMAIATSGNYEKFIMIDGKKYSHTINPKTGLPVTGIKSVTIFSPNAELADAMATPVTIMGIKAGIDLINQVRHLECIIIDDNNKVYASKNIRLK
jgi:thiamine biosynthesis lipoprotein